MKRTRAIITTMILIAGVVAIVFLVRQQGDEAISFDSENAAAQDAVTETEERGDPKRVEIVPYADKGGTEETEPEEETPIESKVSSMSDDHEPAAGGVTDDQKTAEEEQIEIPDISELPAGEVLSEWPASVEEGFVSAPILEGDAVFERINGKSYRENPNIKLEDLRYLKMLHYNFDHEIQIGEMIVNAGVEEDVLAIFRELFEAEYEIQSMYLIDNYWTGDGGSSDTASIEENNTSAFCYRTVTGSSSNLSNHAYGRAIDINPQQNPYVWHRNGKLVWSHRNADPYIDRTSGDPHVIVKGDICYEIFSAHGFSWGGEWNDPIDYQHFEKEG